MGEIKYGGILSDIRLAERPKEFCSRCNGDVTDKWAFRVQGYGGKPDICLCGRCCHDMLAKAISYFPAQKD